MSRPSVYRGKVKELASRENCLSFPWKRGWSQCWVMVEKEGWRTICFLSDHSSWTHIQLDNMKKLKVGFLSKLERNVLLEPAAAMNQMLVLKCFINVDSRLKHVIRNIFTCDLYTLFTLYNVHTLCTMCSVYLVYHVYPAYLGCRVHPVCSAYRVPCLPCVPYVPYKPFVPKLCTKSIQSQYLMFSFSMSF